KASSFPSPDEKRNQRRLPTRRSSDLEELIIRKPLTIQGVGPGWGYHHKPHTHYTQISGFLFTGTGTPRVRTRRNFRGSSSDPTEDRKSTRLNSSHVKSPYAVFCLRKT